MQALRPRQVKDAPLQARRDAAAAFAAVLELPRPEGIMAAMIAWSAERIS